MRVPDPELEPVLRVPQVAEILDVGESTVYDAVKRGEIPSLSVGRRLLIPTAALRQMLGLDPGPNATSGIPRQDAAATTDQDHRIAPDDDDQSRR